MDAIPSDHGSADQNLPELEGFLDRVSWDGIDGWAWSPREPGVRRTIDVLVDGTLLLSLAADRTRADLAESGRGDGGHAFGFRLPQALFAAPLVFVQVRDRATGLDLPGSPVALVNDQAGLDMPSRQFLATRIEALLETGTPDSLDETAAFLLSQMDRLVEARRRSAVETPTLDAFAGLLARQPGGMGGGIGGGIGALIELARRDYGPMPLRLPTSDAPEVSVLIPAFNHFRTTFQCLRSIAEHAPTRTFEVVLIDDGSTDETLLASLVVAGLRLVHSGGNTGFVGAITAGAAASRGRLLLLLNNDTEVRPGWLDALAETFDRDPAVGVVGAKLLSADGRLQECGGIVWRLGDAWNYGRGEDPADPRFCFMRDADYVSGAALMIRRDVWDEVGGLTAAYAPAYYEDTDLCFKVREAGYRVVVQPASCVVHHEGVSAGTDVAGTGMKRFQRVNMVRFAGQWRDRLRQHAPGGTAPPEQEAERHVRRRALFIDDSVPTPDRDAGSNVAVEHMKALMRLGYQVHFVPSDNMARIEPYTGALEQLGIRCHHAPFEHSTEEVLRQNAGRFDVIYLHRVSNAAYLRAARTRNPAAQVIYSVADLHHLRLLREAELLGDAVLRQEAMTMRASELSAAAAADCTITHSAYEAALLTGEAAAVAVVPWVVRTGAPLPPFDRRRGVGFVGSKHLPNLDAALFLLTDVMPLVWAADETIDVYLFGDHVEDPRVRRLSGPRVHAVGWVADLRAAFATLRVTAAPLRFGAGVKGKVLESLAAGLPCVMTPCAAEGAGLPPALEPLVVDGAAALAAQIVALHRDPARNAALAELGMQFVREDYSEARVDAAFAALLQQEVRAHAAMTEVAEVAGLLPAGQKERGPRKPYRGK